MTCGIKTENVEYNFHKMTLSIRVGRIWTYKDHSLEMMYTPFIGFSSAVNEDQVFYPFKSKSLVRAKLFFWHEINDTMDMKNKIGIYNHNYCNVIS